MLNQAIELWPGPMEGVMSPQLIRVASAMGMTNRWMTPFLRISSTLPKTRKLQEFVTPFLESGFPTTIQLMGNRPELLAEAAIRFVDLGVDGINLNFGCPSRQVTSGGAGGGALRNPTQMLTLVETIKYVIPNTPLSVKLRSGWEFPSEMQNILPPLAKTGCVSKFFLHFRTVKELYQTVADRQERFITALQLANPVPMVLNGDINTPDDALELLNFPGVVGVMCARGWLRDPLLLARIRNCKNGNPAPGLPSPNEARHQLFQQVLSMGISVGSAIELSNLLWGKDNPFFEQLKQLPQTSCAPDFYH